MNNIYEDIEKLKKELWHISRVMLPRLMQMISEGGGSSSAITALETALDECESAITALESSLSSVNTNITNLQSTTTSLQTQLSGQASDISSLSSQVSAQSESITSLTNQVGGVSSSMSSLQTAVSDCEDDLSDLSSRVSTAETSLSSLSSLPTTVSNLQTQFSEMSTDFTELSASVSEISYEQSGQYTNMIALSNKVTSMETDLNAVESTVNTDLPSLTTRVSDLEDQVDSLAGGSSALSFDVLFDRASTDENISFGYTGGWLGGVQRNFDLTKYTGLRFFATLGGMGAQYYVKLTNREKADFLMLASNSNASKLYFMKVNIPLALNRIQVAYTGTITINTDGTVERTQGTSGNTSHFLSRIEGYF